MKKINKCENCGHEWECRPNSTCYNSTTCLCILCYIEDNYNYCKENKLSVDNFAFKDDKGIIRFRYEYYISENKDRNCFLDKERKSNMLAILAKLL